MSQEMDRKAYLVFLEKSIEEIKNYYNKQRLALFLGAGISKDSGLPGWKTLIEEFKNDLGFCSGQGVKISIFPLPRYCVICQEITSKFLENFL